MDCKFVADEVVACLDEFFARVDPDTDTQSLFYFYGPIQLHFADYASVYQCKPLKASLENARTRVSKGKILSLIHI